LQLTEQHLQWKLMVDSAGRCGAANMAIDSELLDRVEATGERFLRLYRFHPACLSLGRNEPAADYDGGAIARLGIDVVRRPTGGRAVWHDHEVTYAVAAPIALFGSLRIAYHAIHATLVVALRSLGVDATIALRHPAPSSTILRHAGSCFSTAAPGEILVAGRKLVGSAQVRKGGAFLQHGSILLDGSQDVIAAVGRMPQAASTETTLAAVLGRKVSFDEVTDAISSTVLHQPPPTSTTFLSDLAPLGVAVKS
jgi:lipoyl(octanoyl) transferase